MAERENETHDVIVAGAGPAGVLTAILLARRGHSVVLLAAGRARPRIEGLSQRVLDTLRAHGLSEAAATVGPEVERFVAWNGERSARNREHITDRIAFDTALLRDAEREGVRVLPVQRLTLDRATEGPAARVTASDGGTRVLMGRFLVEARGRSAPSARIRDVRGPATTALVRRIEGGPSHRCTAVESFAEGWAWFVCDGDTAFLQIFVDSSGGLPKQGALRDFFDAQARSLDTIPELLGDGHAVGAVMTRGARARLAADLIGANRLRVGDAAAAVDPLSGHGLFEALGSALAASAVVHTMLERPENSGLARRFYLERTKGGFQRYARVGRDFYALETRWLERPFWCARALWPDREAAHRPPDAEPARIESRPVIEAGFVVESRVVVTADQPRGIWRVAEVPLADLLDLLEESQGLRLAAKRPALAQRLQTSEEQLATAIEWLRARRLLATSDRILLYGEGLESVTEAAGQ